jgi:hypothetical protein
VFLNENKRAMNIEEFKIALGNIEKSGMVELPIFPLNTRFRNFLKEKNISTYTKGDARVFMLKSYKRTDKAIYQVLENVPAVMTFPTVQEAKKNYFNLYNLLFIEKKINPSLEKYRIRLYRHNIHLEIV